MTRKDSPSPRILCLIGIHIATQNTTEAINLRVMKKHHLQYKVHTHVLVSLINDSLVSLLQHFSAYHLLHTLFTNIPPINTALGFYSYARHHVVLPSDQTLMKYLEQTQNV